LLEEPGIQEKEGSHRNRHKLSPRPDRPKKEKGHKCPARTQEQGINIPGQCVFSESSIGEFIHHAHVWALADEDGGYALWAEDTPRPEYIPVIAIEAELRQPGAIG
jgi:hypothetical protein